MESGCILETQKREFGSMTIDGLPVYQLQYVTVYIIKPELAKICMEGDFSKTSTGETSSWLSL